MGGVFGVWRRRGGVWPVLPGFPPAGLREYFHRLADVADRALWGTDWPSPGVKDLRQNIDQFLTLPLTDAHRQAILEGNALALLPPRPSRRGPGAPPPRHPAPFPPRPLARPPRPVPL